MFYSDQRKDLGPNAGVEGKVVVLSWEGSHD